MPVYEYYCRSCQSKFELLRPMRMSNRAAECPEGHTGAERTLSVFIAAGSPANGELAPGGGCSCGGGGCSCRG